MAGQDGYVGFQLILVFEIDGLYNYTGGLTTTSPLVSVIKTFYKIMEINWIQVAFEKHLTATTKPPPSPPLLIIKKKEFD